jgi:valyl-tRNA synthetase
MVDKNFGTGAVKITPAHDQNDYACGTRNKLQFVTIFEKSGHISPGCGEFSGMKRFDCRKVIQERLRELGLYRGVKDNPMVIPVCSRSKDLIEPLSVPQWFCNCQTMAADAVSAVETGELRLIPDLHEKTWNYWLKNIKEWCISRQLWWGHRIPAYFITVVGQAAGNDSDNKYWVSAVDEATALKEAAERFGVDASKISLKQDEDVLDTWFSSGIYPISVLGWPDNTEDMKNFYPGNLLETGHDILFFWVARMVMMCKHLTGKLPFTDVYLHSLVRDAHGRKMSKSLGNVVDPLDVRDGVTLDVLQTKLEKGNLDPKEVTKAKKGQADDYPDGIPECGVDALRFGLCALVSNTGKDINLDISVIKSYRQFCNKMWNATKFAFMAMGDGFAPTATEALSGKESKADLWILSRLAETIEAANTGLETYDFKRATTAIYSFWMYDLSQTYIEWIKPVVFNNATDAETMVRKSASRNVLYTCLDSGFRLISPFMPFVTEELWQRLPRRAGDTTPSICVAAYPTKTDARNSTLEAEIKFVMNLIDTCRSMKNKFGFTSKVTPQVFLVTADAAQAAGVQALLLELNTLAKVDASIATADKVPTGCAAELCEGTKIYMLVKGHINVEAELAKLAKKIQELTNKVEKDEDFFKGPGASKMPADKLAEKQANTEKYRQELSTTKEQADMFRSL